MTGREAKGRAQRLTAVWLTMLLQGQQPRIPLRFDWLNEPITAPDAERVRKALKTLANGHASYELGLEHGFDRRRFHARDVERTVAALLREGSR